MMELQDRHLRAFNRAERLLLHCNFCPYLELKELFRRDDPDSRYLFRSLFTDYYRMNSGGLTESFKDRFFAILFSSDVIKLGRPDFQGILQKLSRFRGSHGRYTLPLSFVSKLAGIHMESSPIFDKYVQAFFGKWTPSASKLKQERISWFVDFLHCVTADYEAWSSNSDMQDILERFKSRDSRLRDCHPVRLIDFLVWTVGSKGLLEP